MFHLCRFLYLIWDTIFPAARIKATGSTNGNKVKSKLAPDKSRNPPVRKKKLAGRSKTGKVRDVGGVGSALLPDSGDAEAKNSKPTKSKFSGRKKRKAMESGDGTTAGKVRDVGGVGSALLPDSGDAEAKNSKPTKSKFSGRKKRKAMESGDATTTGGSAK